ncbi:MAG: efflux RND transporter periplasmic adaptor subunit [Gemmataceae bacterium]
MIYGLIALAVAAAVQFLLLAPREVSVATVERRDVVAEVQGTGTVTTNVAPKVGSKINGRLARVLVDEGDVVKTGQLVALLEDDDLRHQVDRTRARVEEARASAEQARLAWQRARKLVGTRTIGQEEYDGVEEKARVTSSQVSAREADLRYDEFKLSETRIVTPVGGVVTRRWVDPGDAVVAGQPVVTVADTSLIWVAANVDQRFTGKVRKGQPATIVLRGRAGYPFKGQVSRVNPQADAVTEEMLVEVAFPLPPEEFQVGQWAEVFIETGTARDALVVPKTAVLPSGNDRHVFVAGPEGECGRLWSSRASPARVCPWSP